MKRTIEISERGDLPASAETLEELQGLITLWTDFFELLRLVLGIIIDLFDFLNPRQ